ncbi:hypothetical protein [Halomicrococcus sp. SG-WS-1]|uniref:hypothetical protein n=1 Tax=Halomicrococcus sp. SG-WS-1 TaxID=3439057 RepID=UPI003F7AFD9B
MRVRFDAAELKRLSGAAGRIQLYGKYDTTASERVYFDHSVLNANLAASDFGEKRGRDDEPTCEERSNATATASVAGPTRRRLSGPASGTSGLPLLSVADSRRPLRHRFDGGDPPRTSKWMAFSPGIPPVRACA